MRDSHVQYELGETRARNQAVGLPIACIAIRKTSRIIDCKKNIPHIRLGNETSTDPTTSIAREGLHCDHLAIPVFSPSTSKRSFGLFMDNDLCFQSRSQVSRNRAYSSHMLTYILV